MDNMDRRKFLGSMVASAVMTSVWPGGASGQTNGKLKFGLIGCGWYGLVDVNSLMRAGGGEVIAICDVDSDHLEKAALEIEKLQGFKPRVFKHYAKLLELDELQALIIATPPHWHALPFIAALKRGLDIYCEKPLAYDVRESQAMVAASKAYPDCIVQIGHQRRQSPCFRQVRDYIKAGNLGRVIHAEAVINAKVRTGDPTVKEPPAGLDWDLWCGPAPQLPYSEAVGHFCWRYEKEYGNGHLVDWGIHMIDAARWMLDLDMPRSVQAAGGLYELKGRITTPDIMSALMDYDRCPLFWRHHIYGGRDYRPEVSNGVFIYGEKGTVFAGESKWMIIPPDKNAEPEVKEASVDMAREHMADFLAAVKTRRQPAVTPAEGHGSTAAVTMAMIAYQVGAKLTWDNNTSQFTGQGARRANRLLRRDYRAGFEHPWQGD